MWVHLAGSLVHYHLVSLVARVTSLIRDIADLVRLVVVHCQLPRLENALFANAVGYIGGQEVICHLVKLLDALDMRPNDRLFLFEDANVSIHFSVAELIVVEVAQRGRHLVFSLVVEKDMESTCIVINLKLSAHGFLYASQQSADQDDVVDGVAVELANVVRSRLTIHNHPYRDRSKDL